MMMSVMGRASRSNMDDCTPMFMRFAALMKPGAKIANPAHRTARM